MSGKFKAHRKTTQKANAGYGARLEHDLRAAKYEDGLHNHKGHGALPSQLGWGQHKSKKDRVSLFDPWRKL